MTKHILSVNIPTPCSENWENMTPTEQGRHCASCNKVVIDFSGMTDEQIVKILLEQKGKKICGNFYNTQLKKPMLYIQQRSFPKWPAIAAMLVAGMFQLNVGTVNAQRQNQQKVYSRELSIEKYPQKRSEIKTEPASDSLITYTIQVLSSESRSAIPGAKVDIQQMGVYTSDMNGNVILNIEPKKIPGVIRILLTSPGYENKEIRIQRKQLKNAGNIQLYMEIERPNHYMMRGDIDVNYNGN